MRYSTGENTQTLQLLRLPELLFKLFLLCDIAGYIRGADHLTLLVANRRNRQRNVNLLSVFSDAHRFKMLYALLEPEPVENFSLLADAFRGEQNFNRAAGELLTRIAV